jgi:alpha,alpha-trehalose phosphorylase
VGLREHPRDKYPLLLHFHPLVIYRFQVLKQADVVLAMFLQRRRVRPTTSEAPNFEYYDPITTGDSSLSAVVQSIVAAEVGYHELALDYFRQALFVDLATARQHRRRRARRVDGRRVGRALVHGFAGLLDDGESPAVRTADAQAVLEGGDVLRIVAPRSDRDRVDLDADGCNVTVESEPGVPLAHRR